MFKFELGQDVIIKETGKKAQVQAQSKYLYGADLYACIEYSDHNIYDWYSSEEIKPHTKLEIVK